MEIEKIFKTLESIWLNEKEIKIYLTSLSLWQSPASILWSKNNINRSTAQYTCNSLVEKKLFSMIQKWNSIFYSPESPEKILYMLNKEYNILEKKMNDARDIIWELKSISNPKAKLPKVSYYEWIDQVMDMLLNKHAKIKDDTYEFSAHVELLKNYPEEIEKYSKIHMDNRKWFTNYVLDCIESKSNNDKEKYSNLKFKYYKDKDLDIKTHIQIDGDRIAIVSNHNKNPVWIDIVHSEIAKDLRKIFKQLWENLD